MLKELWLTWILVSGLGESVTINAQDTRNLTVVIDGYTVNTTLTSPATLKLGRTALLVCRVSGIPHGQQTSYQWTCPNQPCLQTGYAGRNIRNNIIAFNTTSTSDGGTYTCTVTAGGMNSTQDFRINVTGGDVVHSFGRLIPLEGVISTASQLQPPNNASGDGRIECTVSSGTANFTYTSNDVHNGTTATYNIPAGDFNNFQNTEGSCGSIYHYLFISRNTLPVVSEAAVLRAAKDSLILKIERTENDGITRVIVGYDRLDLGLPMVGQYQNNLQRSTATFTSLVPGARYRITVWGTTAGQSRSTGPTVVVERNTAPSVPSPPRALTVTRVFEDGIELNWLPPRETNGDIHYIIRYTLQNGTAQEITTTDNTNYYNLTGLKRGQTYYSFTVKAANLDDASHCAQSNTIGSYTHNHTLSSPIPTITTTAITTLAITTPATTTTITTPTTKSDTSTATTPTTTLITDNHVLYIGSGAGCLLLVLVAVLAVIICCVVAVHRRGKRSRSTDHTPTLHYYSTPGHEQEEEPQVQIGAATHETVHEKPASFTPGTLYDEVEIKTVKSKPVAVPSEYQLPLVEADKEDDKEAHNTVTIPESFYAQPDTTAKSSKKGQKGTTADVEDPDVLYAEVDKPKKKKKKGKEKKEQPQGDLYAMVDKTSKKKGKEKKAKEKELQADEGLYAEVDKTTKKGKKTKKDKESNSFREAVELDSPPPVPDRSLIYEPSADHEASDQEQQQQPQQHELEQQKQVEQQEQPEEKDLQGQQQ